MISLWACLSKQIPHKVCVATGSQVDLENRTGVKIAGWKVQWRSLLSELTDHAGCLSGSCSFHEQTVDSLAFLAKEVVKAWMCWGDGCVDHAISFTSTRMAVGPDSSQKSLHSSFQSKFMPLIRCKSFFSFIAADSFQWAEKHNIKYRKHIKCLPISGQIKTFFLYLKYASHVDFTNHDLFSKLDTIALWTLVSIWNALKLCCQAN